MPVVRVDGESSGLRHGNSAQQSAETFEAEGQLKDKASIQFTCLYSSRSVTKRRSCVVFSVGTLFY